MENETVKNEGQKVTSSEIEHHPHTGPLLGMLVVVLVLILGGLYLWGAMLNNEQQRPANERTIPNNEPETTRAETDKEILNTLSPSTELDAIYADLESTNLDSLDAELDQITAEMKTMN